MDDRKNELAKISPKKKKGTRLVVLFVIIIFAALFLVLYAGFHSSSFRVHNARKALTGYWEASYQYKNFTVSNRIGFFTSDSTSAEAIVKIVDEKGRETYKSDTILTGTVSINELDKNVGTIYIDGDAGVMSLAYVYDPQTKEMVLTLLQYWGTSNLDNFGKNLGQAGTVVYEKCDI